MSWFSYDNNLLRYQLEKGLIFLSLKDIKTRGKMKRIWSGLKELEKGEESWYGGKEKIDYSIKDLGVNVADPEAMNIPFTLILSYIFVGIMPLYAINLNAVSLFADSAFMFLAVLNDVISRFE
ncbi:transmembrane protein, putative [Medicago truncatula]|uniref:Transmembrane protein, putative n=1 Tax=Medicago truncatula TaxID=3880 RepID=G7IGM3_MEDTR|nr:transmembrane protein, putative [Medicago truncatula]